MNNMRKNSGFSIIEMFLSTLMVISLSAISYRVLQKQTNVQMTAIENQKNVSASKTALNRFKVDASKVDPNWARYGIASVYPHQGYGFNDNYYLMTTTNRKTISANDGITFLRRSTEQDRLYVPTGTAERLCYPTAALAGDQLIYNTEIQLDSINKLAVNDWMLVWQAGNYMLGVVASVRSANGAASASTRSTTTSMDSNGGSGTGNLKYVRLRALTTKEKQATKMNGSGYSTGFVNKHGVVAASFDLDGNATTDTSDNSFCFTTSKMNFQKIDPPVSYFVDYQTSDGKLKGSNNTYKLDQKRGDKIKMLVRSEFVNGSEIRQYIAPIDQVAFFYDLMSDAGIARDVGREKSSAGLLNLNTNNAAQATANFLTSYKIVAVKMQLDSKTQDRNSTEDFMQSSNVKIAFDPTLQQDLYQDKLDVTSAATNNLNTLPKGTIGVANETIGKPLYLVTGNNREVVVPVSTVEVLPDGSMGPQSTGKIYIYNSSGCAINSSTNCEPSASGSTVSFYPGNNKTFFPSSISQINLADGSRKIIVGGVAMSSGLEIKREPGIGVISLQQNQTLENKIDEGGQDSNCSITNCKWISLNNTTSELTGLMDTANIAIDPSNQNNIYIAPMTKKFGRDSQASVYKGTLTPTGMTVSKFANIARAEQGKVVSAISDKPIKIANVDYFAVCLTKNMSDSCGGECISDPEKVVSPTLETTKPSDNVGTTRGSGTTSTVLTTEQMYGEIQLVKNGSGIGAEELPIRVAMHNYSCSSLSVDDNQNLIIAGRLTVQPLAYSKIKDAVIKKINRTDMLYLDEAISGTGTSLVYADYFKVDPETYTNAANQMYIGWITGMSAVQFPDGTFGMVNGNKYRKAGGASTSTNGQTSNSGPITEYSNAGISTLSLSGMGDRVIATIETDPSNINQSIITASYAPRTSELPSIYIPGKFLTKTGRVRTSPTPLPSMPAELSEKSWFTLYQSLLTSKGETGLNSQMPVLDTDYVEVTNCGETKPKTCE